MNSPQEETEHAVADEPLQRDGDGSYLCPRCGRACKSPSGAVIHYNHAHTQEYCENGVPWDKEYYRNTNAITVSCLTCGVELHRYGEYAEPPNYCSQECYHEWRSENMRTGADHPNWKGGGANNRHYGSLWREQRKKALKRDNHECQYCDWTNNDTTLEVHHIIPLREFDEPEKAHSPMNLTSLCRSCHGQWDGEINRLIEGRETQTPDLRSRVNAEVERVVDDLGVESPIS